jgi:hypothetical protein
VEVRKKRKEKAAARHLPAKQASLTGASGAAHTQLIFLSAY